MDKARVACLRGWPPPPWRWVVLMCLAFLASTVAGEPPTAVPSGTPQGVAPSVEQVMAGRYVFERQCVVCHGKWGDGRGEMAEGMIPRPRRLTSGVFKYRSTPTGFLPTDADLERTLRTGVGGTSMPSFGHLSEREITSVIVYVKTLSSRWRRPTNHTAAVALPPVPGWFEDAAERRRHAGAGGAVFGRLCVPCHGVGAAGDGPSAASLEDVWGDPIRPADLRQPLARSGPGWGDLYRTITTGLDGTPMMGFGEVTTPEERWELVAFIRERREAFLAGERMKAGPRQ